MTTPEDTIQSVQTNYKAAAAAIKKAVDSRWD
jgi:hypothetical protein